MPRNHSEFFVACVCGCEIHTPKREFVCPKCKRLIQLAWPADYPKLEIEKREK